MNDVEQIIKIAEMNNGTITSRDVSGRGLQRRALAECVAAGKLTKGSRGIYFLPNQLEDEFAIWQYTYPQGIFSGNTALYLHQKTERFPDTFCMTFPKGYNVTAAKSNGIRCKTVIEKNFELGLQNISSPYGNPVRCYNIERTLCDIVRTTDQQVTNQTFKDYAKSQTKNLALLMEYAKKLRVEKKVRRFLEVLL